MSRVRKAARTRPHWSASLPADTCADAVRWARTQPSAAAAWRTCERGDWMLWLLGKQSGAPGSDGRRKLVLAACACARLALPYVRKGEDRPRIAIETAEAWARGEAGVTMEDVRKAADAAADASYAAADAAYAADAATDAVADASNSVAYVVAISAAAAYAVADSVADTARKSTLKQCADIVRQHYPRAPKLRSAT